MNPICAVFSLNSKHYSNLNDIFKTFTVIQS